MLKTLKADSDDDIKLSSFQITCLVHDIENNEIYFGQRGGEIGLLITAREHIRRIERDRTRRESITSPNGTEKPFKSDSVVNELSKLRSELDNLITDINSNLQAPENRRLLENYAA